MKVFKWYVFVLALFASLNSNAQIPLNGSFFINEVSEGPTTPGSNYTIGGVFTDPISLYFASDIKKGDMIADQMGLLFRIDNITRQSGDQISADVTYIRGSIFEGFSYPTAFAMGTLFRPTSNGYPLTS